MKNDEEMTMYIETDNVRLQCDLCVPEAAHGLVVFAHGSGSSRLSPRNQYVAKKLQASGLGTLLADLLTPEEERIDRVTRELRFDMDLLQRRVVGLVDWADTNPTTTHLNLGCFGASTGAAGALLAAADRPESVRAVVSRGGRPDLAADALPKVIAPTLLIVGGNDEQVVEYNEQALEILTAEKVLSIVPGASHLFEEPGALDQVTDLSRNWFVGHLGE